VSILKSIGLRLGSLGIAVSVVTACGVAGLGGGKRDGASDLQAVTRGLVVEDVSLPGTPPEQDVPVLRLKGVALLAASLVQTVGSGRDVLQVTPTQRVSLFEVFAPNFGVADNAELGKRFADDWSVGYFLALATVADNAGTLIADDLTAEVPGTVSCKTKEDARAMLQRAIPYQDFGQAQHDELIESLRSTCERDPRLAVSALVGSFAFAAKN
jgi:hypothetical protein